MKIVHVYAQNLSIFVDAVKDTDCRLNASRDIDYMINSLQNFNGRDVLGLVIFANPITKKCLRLIKKFDELFVFKEMPIIIISDNANEMYNMGYFRVKSSKLFLIDSEDNSISDIEISSIFTTLLAFSDSMYDLSGIPSENRQGHKSATGEIEELGMSEQLSQLLESLKRGEFYANSSGGEQFSEGISFEEKP